MQKLLLRYSIIGYVIVSISGSLSHFIFEWTDYNLAVAFFCPVNESVWEHLKLLLFPYLIWTVIEYLLLKKEKGIIISKSIGVIIGMLSIIIFYYTYTGISGQSVEILNILSFFIGVSAAFSVDSYLIKSQKLASVKLDTVGIAVFIGICALFFIFTIAPPFIPLFKDPVTSTYGI